MDTAAPTLLALQVSPPSVDTSAAAATVVVSARVADNLAGVSSGIDMALVLLDHLRGPETAQLIQLAIEYDPQPPFDAGSPSKAPAALVELVQAMIGDGPALPTPSTTGDAR